MEQKQQQDIDNVSDTTTNENIVNNENIFTIFLNYLFKEKPWVGSIAVFIITIILNAVSGTLGGNVSLLRLVIITFLVTIILFICLSPVLVMHLVKNLRHLIINDENENIKNIRESANSLKLSTEKLDISIEQNKDYFEKAINHMDNCPGIDNLVKKSHMINNVDEYYQHLTRARENADKKDVILTNFSTKPYEIGNQNRNKYYSTNNSFINRTKCNVYRIVTVHTSEKLSFLKELINDAKKSKSQNYYLAYLDIEKFSDDNGDTLPGIIGIDIIENEVIIMDFSYARALRKNGVFIKPLYIESEKIAEICRDYYKKIWEDLSGVTPESRRRYQGHILYNGPTGEVIEDIDNILAKIEYNISVMSQSKVTDTL